MSGSKREIDVLDKRPCSRLRSFVLPAAAAPAAACLHLARTICPPRRAPDRRACGAGTGEAVSAPLIKYVNRLSDFLFVASRYANDKGGRRCAVGAGRQPLIIIRHSGTREPRTGIRMQTQRGLLDSGFAAVPRPGMTLHVIQTPDPGCH